MRLAARQGLSAAGFLAIVVLLFGGAISTFAGIWDARLSLAAEANEAEALRARAQRVAPHKSDDKQVSLLIDAPTITLAGAILQQRVETAVEAAGGKVISSQVEVGGQKKENQVGLVSELTIAQPGMQKLLFDLETGRPFLFVTALEATTQDRAETSDQIRLSLTLFGQWGAAK